MRKLYRSSRDRKLFGVCGGLAEYFAVDATLLRILLIVVAVFSAGSVILVYIIAGFVIPRETAYGSGYGANPFDQGWKGPEQPQYGTQSWNPGSTNWQGSNANHSTANNPHSGPAAGNPPTTGRSSGGLDAMMEDIEKKAMQREIDELKARINKFEKESKGE
ncbi:PspC domain-containing protein [Cohnella sp.]|uniref:PspC domain-containing protein n=1 Tax=Cohnella sp. TaxID=1883426 RepID=UPI0035647ACD